MKKILLLLLLTGCVVPVPYKEKKSCQGEKVQFARAIHRCMMMCHHAEITNLKEGTIEWSIDEQCFMGCQLEE